MKEFDPAYPIPQPEHQIPDKEKGISKLDYFAAKAMQVILNYQSFKDLSELDYIKIARASYKIGSTMMEQRKNHDHKIGDFSTASKRSVEIVDLEKSQIAIEALVRIKDYLEELEDSEAALNTVKDALHEIQKD